MYGFDNDKSKYPKVIHSIDLGTGAKFRDMRTAVWDYLITLPKEFYLKNNLILHMAIEEGSSYWGQYYHLNEVYYHNTLVSISFSRGALHDISASGSPLEVGFIHESFEFNENGKFFFKGESQPLSLSTSYSNLQYRVQSVPGGELLWTEDANITVNILAF